MGNKSLIPNKQIEEMFLRIADDAEVSMYISLVNRGFKAQATAYASGKVYRKFFELVGD